MPPQLITALLLLGVFVFTLIAFSVGSYILLLLGIIAPALFVFGTRLDLVLVAVVALSLSSLTIPGMPVDLYLYQIMMAFFVVMAIARYSIQKERSPKPPGRLWAQAFLAVLIIVIMFRGMGFRMFGGAKAGGAVYVQVLITILFYLLSGAVTLPDKKWRTSVVLMALLTLAPFLLQLVVILSRGAIWQPLLFVRMGTGLRETFAASASGSEATRWTILASLASIYLVAAILWPFRRPYLKRYALFFGLSLVVSVMSGYRHATLIVATFIVLFIMIQTSRPILVAALLLAAGVVGILILIPIVDHLPFAAQRVFTMVPGVHVSGVADIQASYTMEWRRLLWKMAIADMNQYLLIGKGYAYDYAVYGARMTMPLFSQADEVRAYLITGDLHQGALDMLYNLGVPGFVVFLGWVITEIVWHGRRQAREWHSVDMRRYHLVFLLLMTVNALQAFLAGISRNFLVTLPFQMAILHTLVLSDEAQHVPSARPVSARPESMPRAIQRVRP